MGFFLKKIRTEIPQVGIPTPRITSIHVDSIGDIYVTNNPISSGIFSSVTKYNSDGSFDRRWSVKTGEENFRLGTPIIYDISTDSTNNIFVIYQFNAQEKRILKYSSSNQSHPQQFDISNQAIRPTKLDIDSSTIFMSLTTDHFMAESMKYFIVLVSSLQNIREFLQKTLRISV